MLLPDSRTTAFELIRPPAGYRLDFAVLTTYTLDLEALLVLPLSVLAHPDGGLDELLADPLRLHQAIRDAGDRVHAFVDVTGIGVPRSARPLYFVAEDGADDVQHQVPGREHESAYWQLVLHYCRQGNLQAVLGEQWHLLWEQDSWSEDASADETAAKCARKLVQVVHPARARVHAEFFRAEPGESGATVERDAIRVRTVFALRFGHVRTDDGEHISQDAVRAAFNSPFRPFVLTSTSIGQEGLDFHPWCHRLVHWNLPGNPVDLEQREGRIHRYKGHAVRRNVAAPHADDAFAAWSAGKDIWTLMFELANNAARAAEESDLVPHWLAPGDHRVERHVPQLPYTAEVEAFDRLKRPARCLSDRFGQPRQEELVTLLDRASVDVARLRDWAVDLSPPGPQRTREEM